MTDPQDTALRWGLPRTAPFAAPVLLAGGLVLAAMGCASEPPPPEPEYAGVLVTLAVEHDVAVLLSRWRRDVAEAGGREMKLIETDAALGLTALVEGRVDAAIVLRLATPAERRHAEGEDLIPQEGLRYELLARLPVTFLIHESNVVEVMTEEDLGRVISGEVREWDSMGGPSEEIALYGRPPRSSTAAQLESLLAGRAPALAMKALPSDAAVATAVRADPRGLGISGGAPGLGTKPLAVRRGDQLLMPGLGTSSKEPWPWVRNVYIVTQGRPARRVLEVRDFARSDRGRLIAERSGFFGWVEGWK